MSGLVFRARQPVRFAHCDAAGIVFFPRYFEMLNGVIEDWFAQGLGITFSQIHLEQGASVPTAALETTFSRPSRLEDPLDFSLTVTRIGGASCAIRHRIHCGEELRVECAQTLVYVGPGLKPAPWPELMRSGLNRYLET